MIQMKSHPDRAVFRVRQVSVDRYGFGRRITVSIVTSRSFMLHQIRKGRVFDMEIYKRPLALASSVSFEAGGRGASLGGNDAER